MATKVSLEEYFRDLIGPAEAEAFLKSIENKDTRRSLRVNTLKTTKTKLEKWLKSQGYTVSDNPYSSDGLDIEGRGERLALKLPYHAGFTYPQDSSSMFAVELLDPKPGETVLDLTAAPGGKTTHIAQRMKNTGVLMANDLDTRRLKALHSNLERLGIWNTVVMRSMPHTLAKYYPETFDRILLDPSCSGEGLLVTREGKLSFWNPKALKRYSKDQYGLLLSAFRLLKPGGRLVYSTCTLNDQEDDAVVQRLFKKYPEAKLDSMDHVEAPEQIGDLMGIRFWPHKTRTKGFFCIAITKTDSLNLLPEMDANEKLKVLSSKARLEYQHWADKQFGLELPDIPFTLRDDHLFLVSNALSKFPLPTRYSLGFPLLKIYENEMRPTHAGAQLLGLKAKKQIYEPNRENLEKIFERQPIPNLDGELGTFLARYKDFPLGVTKKTEKRIEVLLPRQY